MKRLISIIPLLILALIFGFACTSIGLESKVTEAKPDYYNIESLIEDLKDENSFTRANAALSLGNTGDSKAIEPLIEALRDENSFVRQNAATALGHIGDSQAIEPLIEVILKDKIDFVKQVAAKALANIGELSFEPLLKMLGNEDGNVRKNAAMALGLIGDAKAVEPLIEALKDEHTGVRQNAAAALGLIKDTRAVEPLIEVLLKDTNSDVIKNVAIALGNFGELALEPLFKALETEGDYVQMRVAKALGYINDPRAIKFLTDALNDKKLDIIAGAYNFFIIRGEEGTVDILIEVLNKHGNVDMAEDYLNCGNGQLSKAARTWATEHGYTITQWPTGGSGQSWGANK